MGSLLSSLPWPLRLPPPSLRPAICEKTAPRLPPPLKGLSLISMPLGLLHRLLPNKHSQDLLQCLLYFVCHPHSSLTIHLPPFLCFLTVLWSSLSARSCSTLEVFMFKYSGFSGTAISVPSVVCISPEDILSPCVGNVKLLYVPVSFFMWGKRRQMEEKQRSELVNVSCKSRGHMVEITRWRANPHALAHMLISWTKVTVSPHPQ